MDYYFHRSIAKYTGALLDLFNDIQVQRTLTDDTVSYSKVPIQFASKDKAFVMSNKDRDQYTTGNYNFLPRMSLSLNSIRKNPSRDTHRLHSITYMSTNGLEQYHTNAVAYDILFTVSIATRTMTDTSMILEQILPYFNPTYNIAINEIPIQQEPTIVPLHLDDVGLNIPEQLDQESDIRIIETTLSLTLNGQMYPPIKDTKLIEHIKLNFNVWYGDKPLIAQDTETFDIL